MKTDRDLLNSLYNALYHHSLICYRLYEENEGLRVLINEVMNGMSETLQKLSSPGISTKSPLAVMKYLDLLPISYSNIKIIPSKLKCLKDQTAGDLTLQPYFYPSLIRDIFKSLGREKDPQAFLRELVKSHCKLFDQTGMDILQLLLDYYGREDIKPVISKGAPYGEFCLNFFFSGLLIKTPMIKTSDSNSDTNVPLLIRSFFVHSMMLHKQLSAQKQRLKSFRVDSKIQFGFMDMLEFGLKTVKEVSELIIPKQSTEFVQNWTNLLGDHLQLLKKMPSSDVPNHSIKVSKYVPNFDVGTFLPPNRFEYMRRF